MVNIAMALSGRTVVNLNFTVGSEALQDSIKQAELQTVITSRLFIEKSKCEIPNGVTVLFIEDLIKQITPLKRFTALLMGYCIPISIIEKYCGCEKDITVNDPLTIIFTSGSTGKPKGVVLSHFNMSSNAEAVSQVIPNMGKKTNLLASLPLFHSFGYMMMWLGLNHKFGLITQSNPLDNQAIGELVKKYSIKLMMSTPTFLRGYIKQVLPDQFGSLECVIAGAEKLPKQVADSFESKFGISVMEGYGATECSPVIATSTLDVRQAGIYQVGTIQGSVGQTLPGVIAKVVDPETYQELSLNTEGLLLVKGPNIMQGYLGREDLTAQVMHEGWYITGDIAIIDDNGFITITDRMKRISKIGGEMVPHGRVEEALHEAAEEENQVFAVTAIPDAAKGEKLVVLHTLELGQLDGILKKMTEKGLPNLYLPRQDHFIKVEKLPFLGSGKLDLQLSKKIALEQLASV
jgi:acyl-[acyl-carrier-protein]-phospholipid O-acyltransferase/long-chain-fatty-acid--[acyl-carrier-protein] ligase